MSKLVNGLLSEEASFVEGEACMKIAMFSWEALHGWAAALQRRGHEVHVFTRPGYGTGYARKICRRGTDILNHDI